MEIWTRYQIFYYQENSMLKMKTLSMTLFSLIILLIHLTPLYIDTRI